MLNSSLWENVKVVQGLAPDADALAGTKTTDVVSLKKFAKATFVVHRGVGTTGTQTITVEECDNVTPSNTTAIAFKYRRIDTSTGTIDEAGAVTDAAAAGFTTAAGGSDIYLIEVSSEMLSADRPYVRLKSVEVVDAAVDAGVMVLLSGPRVAAEDLPSAVS